MGYLRHRRDRSPCGRPRHNGRLSSLLGERRSRGTGKPLALGTKYGLVSTANSLFKTLHERGLILANPMRGFTLGVSGDRPVRIHLSEAEVARFLDNIDTDAPCGARDRALRTRLFVRAPLR